MPIKSYVVWPAPDKKQELVESLSRIPGCQVLPAENQELLVLVTESVSEQADEALFEQVQQLDTLQCLTLVAGTSEGDLTGIQPASKEVV